MKVLLLIVVVLVGMVSAQQPDIVYVSKQEGSIRVETLFITHYDCWNVTKVITVTGGMLTQQNYPCLYRPRYKPGPKASKP
jgi:hypothetical protein